MKKILSLLLISVSIVFVGNAQLTDSKWRSTMNIPQPVETFLHFKKDTLLLSVVADGSLVETMVFSISKDTLKLTKVSGMSPCQDNIIGLYRFEMKEDKLTITPLSDDCPERSSAFNAEPWTREKI
ncbi:MAG: hypothetical protein ACKVOW_05140 [Chitinophagaceae bacterium]